MALIKCFKRANRIVVTSRGNIEFNKDGIANVEDEALANAIVKLAGYSFVEAEESTTQSDTQNEGESQIPEQNNAVETNSTEQTKDVDEPSESKEDADEVEGEETESDEAENEEPDFESMSVKQLEKYAKDNDIDLGKATKKADIISVIKQSI